MGKRSHPPLTPNEVIEILIALGFAKRGQEGSHAQYLRLGTNKRKTALVTVDVHYKEFDSDLIHKMIRQSGFGRKEFYGATKLTAKRANVPFLSPSSLLSL
jgi:predicted RNA binding protein YcfA (HicA-like mRNA interferase family)